jgi:hypothetical protein
MRLTLSDTADHVDLNSELEQSLSDRDRCIRDLENRIFELEGRLSYAER